MDTRQDVIQKAYTLLVMMEKVTGYAPGEEFYKNVVASLQAMDEAKLNETFMKIAEIVTNSVDRAAQDVAEIRKAETEEGERAERTKEIEEVSEILNF